MAQTLTPRLGLSVWPDGQIGVQHPNWDRVDQVAGLIYTTSTAGQPADSVLYNNCVVVEKDTGISYRMYGSPGAWTKNYVNYPFAYWAFENRTNVPNGDVGFRGWPTLLTDYRAKNVKAANTQAGTNYFVALVKAIYSLRFTYQWSYPSVAGSQLWASFGINGTEQTDYRIINEPIRTDSSFKMTQTVLAEMLLSVGDTVQAKSYNNGAGTIGSMLTAFQATIVRPVW